MDQDCGLLPLCSIQVKIEPEDNFRNTRAKAAQEQRIDGEGKVFSSHNFDLSRVKTEPRGVDELETVAKHEPVKVGNAKSEPVEFKAEQIRVLGASSEKGQASVTEQDVPRHADSIASGTGPVPVVLYKVERNTSEFGDSALQDLFKPYVPSADWIQQQVLPFKFGEADPPTSFTTERTIPAEDEKSSLTCSGQTAGPTIQTFSNTFEPNLKSIASAVEEPQLEDIDENSQEIEAKLDKDVNYSYRCKNIPASSIVTRRKKILDSQENQNSVTQTNAFSNSWLFNEGLIDSSTNSPEFGIYQPFPSSMVKKANPLLHRLLTHRDSHKRAADNLGTPIRSEPSSSGDKTHSPELAISDLRGTEKLFSDFNSTHEKSISLLNEAVKTMQYPGVLLSGHDEYLIDAHHNEAMIHSDTMPAAVSTFKYNVAISNGNKSSHVYVSGDVLQFSPIVRDLPNTTWIQHQVSDSSGMQSDVKLQPSTVNLKETQFTCSGFAPKDRGAVFASQCVDYRQLNSDMGWPAQNGKLVHKKRDKRLKLKGTVSPPCLDYRQLNRVINMLEEPPISHSIKRCPRKNSGFHVSDNYVEKEHLAETNNKSCQTVITMDMDKSLHKGSPDKTAMKNIPLVVFCYPKFNAARVETDKTVQADNMDLPNVSLFRSRKKGVAKTSPGKCSKIAQDDPKFYISVTKNVTSDVRRTPSPAKQQATSSSINFLAETYSAGEIDSHKERSGTIVQAITMPAQSQPDPPPSFTSGNIKQPTPPEGGDDLNLSLNVLDFCQQDHLRFLRGHLSAFNDEAFDLSPATDLVHHSSPVHHTTSVHQTPSVDHTPSIHISSIHHTPPVQHTPMVHHTPLVYHTRSVRLTSSVLETPSVHHTPALAKSNGAEGKPDEGTSSNVLFRCPKCQSPFKSLARRQAHLLRHECWSQNLQRCKQCDIGFSEVNGLKRHEKVIHQNQKFFQCALCEKIFSDGNRLHNHLMCHIGEIPLGCNFCSLDYKDCICALKRWKIQSGICQDKTLIQDGVRPAGIYKHCRIPRRHGKPGAEGQCNTASVEKYECPECGMEFGTKPTWHRHFWAHSTNSLFKCASCGKQFSILADLRKHVRFHTRVCIYKCTLCTEIFTSLKERDVHQKYHSSHVIRRQLAKSIRCRSIKTPSVKRKRR